MDKRGTVAASAVVCCGLLAAGRTIDRHTSRRQLAGPGAAVLAGAYLAGTYMHNLPLFGAVARPAVTAGDRAFSLTFDDGPDPQDRRGVVLGL